MGLRKIRHRHASILRNCVVGGAAISLLLCVCTIIAVVSFSLKSRTAYEWIRGGQVMVRNTHKRAHDVVLTSA